MRQNRTSVKSDRSARRPTPNGQRLSAFSRVRNCILVAHSRIIRASVQSELMNIKGVAEEVGFEPTRELPP